MKLYSYSYRMHDFDNNTKLDGLEIFKALTHLLPYEEEEEKTVDVRGKSPDDIAREKRQNELLFYSGCSIYVFTCRCLDNFRCSSP